MIHWELHKVLKFGHVNQPETVLENEMYEIFFIFIIKACQQPGFLWLSLTIHPYRPLLLVGPLDLIQ